MSAVLSAVNDDFSQDRQVAQLRIPPHSIEAEASVLGGLLFDNGAWDRVLSRYLAAHTSSLEDER